MKRILSIIAAIALVGFNLSAATVSVSVSGGAVSNIITGSFTATQFVLTSAANNVGLVKLHDAPSATLTNVVPSYITTGAYATNYITTYTNYFGSTNSFTNIALVQYSITNAATTNYYPIVLSVAAGTNQTVALQGVDYFFSRGLTVTNSGAAAASFSVTYVQ